MMSLSSVEVLFMGPNAIAVRFHDDEDPEYKVDVKIDRPQDATKSDGVLVHGYVQDEGHTIAKRTVRIK
jgi:hypothetical protein